MSSNAFFSIARASAFTAASFFRSVVARAAESEGADSSCAARSRVAVHSATTVLKGR